MENDERNENVYDLTETAHGTDGDVLRPPDCARPRRWPHCTSHRHPRWGCCDCECDCAVVDREDSRIVDRTPALQGCVQGARLGWKEVVGSTAIARLVHGPPVHCCSHRHCQHRSVENRCWVCDGGDTVHILVVVVDVAVVVVVDVDVDVGKVPGVKWRQRYRHCARQSTVVVVVVVVGCTEGC